MRDGNEKTYALLVNSLEKSLASDRPKPALLLGAGCSLSSSSKQITTSALMYGFLKDYGIALPLGAPDSEVFREFTNVKERLGHEQFADYFRAQLKDAVPSIGYRCVAKLVERGIFGAVLTTNFDMLLDKALEDVPHGKCIGENSLREAGDAPVLFKLHGDIDDGVLRFSPEELQELPASICDFIGSATRGPTLVVGYRGQDLGVMKSLDRSPKYNAFWSSYDYLDEDDTYTNGRIIKWLRDRHSEGNILQGTEFGDFDHLMERLASDLSDGATYSIRHALASSGVYTDDDPIWVDSIVHASVARVPRLKTVFHLLASYAADTFGLAGWNAKSPFAHSSIEAVRGSFLPFLHAGALPERIASIIANEADALLFAAALECRMWMIGLPSSSSDNLSLLQREYGQFCSGYILPDEFWNALREIVGEGRGDNNPTSLKIFLNNQRRVSLIVDQVPLQGMKTLMHVLDALVIFLGTESESLQTGQEDPLHILPSRVIDRGCIGERISIRLRPITRSVFTRLVKNHLEKLPGAHWEPGTGIFTSEFLDVRCDEFEGVVAPVHRNLVEAVTYEASRRMRRFVSGNRGFEIAPLHPVQLKAGSTIREFLASDKVGCLLLGSSGSGKTTSIRELIEDRSMIEHICPLVVSPRTDDIRTSGVELFFPPQLTGERTPESVLKDMDVAFGTRNRTLVLILDGLNEITGDGAIDAAFSALVDIVAAISLEGLKAIKVLITCRDATFEARLAQWSRLDPKLFHIETGQGGLSTPFVRIADLSRREQDRLIDAFFDLQKGERVKALFDADPHLARQFTHPYMIAVASRTIEDPDTDLAARSASELFGRFVEAMIRSVEDGATRQTAESILTRLVQRSLAAGRQCWSMTRYQLFEALGNSERSDFAEALTSLRDAKILRLDLDFDRVHFTHERMTEYVVGRHLHHCGDGERAAIIARHDRLDPVLIGGFRVFFEMIARDVAAGDAGDHPRRLSEDTRSYLRAPRPISGALVSSLATIRARPCGSFLNRILLERRTEGAGADVFAALICRGAREALNAAEAARIGALLEYVSTAVKAVVGWRERAELHLMSAMAARLNGDLDRAEGMAERAEMLREGGEDSCLADLIEAERAIIAREKGRNGEAITRLQIVFDRQWSEAAIEPALHTSIELGAALRNDTQFDRALALYNRMWGRREEFEEVFWVDVLLGRSVVLKNIMQNMAREGAAQLQGHDLDRFREFTTSCLADLDKSRLLAEKFGKHDALLTATSESIEIHLVLYRMYRTDERRKFVLDEMAELDRRLVHLPDAATAVELFRYKAIFEDIDGKTDEAFVYVGEGRKLAETAGLRFSVADCDYLVTRLAVQHLSELNTAALHHALACAQNALDYYSKHVSRDNIYRLTIERRREAIAEEIAARTKSASLEH